MSAATKQMVLKFLANHNGDVESCARWMRDTLRLGGIKAMRGFIAEAQS